MNAKPLFSICHTSARPDKWRAVYDDWMAKAVNPADVEYVLCIDPRWGFSLDPAQYDTALDNLVLVQNTGRRCYVDGVNLAARASSGAFLIVNADDQFACDAWDFELIKAYSPDIDATYFAGGVPRPRRDVSVVFEVTTGTPNEHERRIMPMPILSRKRFENQGNEVMYSGYESMCSDNDFCEHAIQDGVVIDARHLFFPHRHPMFNESGWKDKVDPVAWDQAYRVQNQPEVTKAGLELLKRRRIAKFAPVTPKRSIAMCYPGDDFRGPMHDALMDLYAHFIANGWEVYRIREATSNVNVTREQIQRAIKRLNPRPEFVLWMDHDNPLGCDQFERLLAGLEAHPEADGMAGWCYIYDNQKTRFTPSCGEWSPDHLHWAPFPPSFARESEIREFECGGFPCLLLRYSAVEKAGEGPFLPILDSRLEHGLLGEDFAFFLRSEKGGAKFLVDPTVRVPHLKYGDFVPYLPEDGGPEPVKIACMMRVKNEARWIARVIESVRSLCGENIFVMEDGSTDDTFAIAQTCGATVWKSPFDGMGLDEKRDKDWLLSKVRESCDPDWILMPDGDEELEAGGPEKIRALLEKNPPFDCFSLRILNLWDRVDQIRTDGCYGQMSRQSLFRARTDMTFRSIYEGEGENHNHVVLHVSNAPGLGGLRLSALNVCLLHYGNMLREDRIRKYNWILSIDPANEGEDFYRHCVQGDLPEFPADAKFKHGGPLALATLPARLVPRWSKTPEPREEYAAVT